MGDLYDIDPVEVTVINYIEVDDLVLRWTDREIDGVKLDLACIEHLVMNEQLIGYQTISYVFENGKKYPIAYRVSNLKDCDLPFSSPNYIISLRSVFNFESNNHVIPNDKDWFGNKIDIPLDKNLTEQPKNIIAIQKNLAEKDKLIDELQEKLSALEKREQEIKRECQTMPGTIAKLKNQLEEWKGILPAMLEVALICFREDKKNRNRNDIGGIFKKRLGKDITDTQLDVFREAMPGDYILRKDKNKAVPNNVESIE